MVAPFGVLLAHHHTSMLGSGRHGGCGLIYFCSEGGTDYECSKLYNGVSTLCPSHLGTPRDTPGAGARRVGGQGLVPGAPCPPGLLLQLLAGAPVPNHVLPSYYAKGGYSPLFVLGG